MEELRKALGDAGISLGERVIEQLGIHFDLLLRWNSRMNLSAVREPEAIARRHFLESIFAAQHVPQDVETLLDFGSGAGFPGLPIAVLRPEIRVTLAESQTKKGAFLREVVRNAGLSCVVYEGRVEKMDSNRIFDVVAMRAVDKMETAIPQAIARTGVALLWMTTEESFSREHYSAKMRWDAPIAISGSEQRDLLVGRK